MSATFKRVKIRAGTFNDCDDVVRLEHVIFPNYGEKFDRRFFSTVKPIVSELLNVATVEGQIQGYLSIAPLSRSAVDFLLSEDITSIKELPTSYLLLRGEPLGAMFLEVLATAPWADFRVRYLLINHALTVFRNSLNVDWYAHPITSKGRRLAERLGFAPVPDSQAGLFRRPRSQGGVASNEREVISRS